MGLRFLVYNKVQHCMLSVCFFFYWYFIDSCSSFSAACLCYMPYTVKSSDQGQPPLTPNPEPTAPLCPAAELQTTTCQSSIFFSSHNSFISWNVVRYWNIHTPELNRKKNAEYLYCRGLGNVLGIKCCHTISRKWNSEIKSKTKKIGRFLTHSPPSARTHNCMSGHAFNETMNDVL